MTGLFWLRSSHEVAGETPARASDLEVKDPLPGRLAHIAVGQGLHSPLVVPHRMGLSSALLECPLT